MNLGEHLVEAVDELRDLVCPLAGVLDANVIDTVARHGASDRGQAQQRRRDRALHAGREDDGEAERAEEHECDHQAGRGRLIPEHGQVRLDHHRANHVIVEDDRARQQKDPIGEFAPEAPRWPDVERARRQDSLHGPRAGPVESGKLTPVLRPDHRGDDAVVDGQRANDFAGGFGIAERDRRRAVGPDHVGQHTGVANESRACARQIPGQYGCHGNDERDRARQHAEECQLPRQRQAGVPGDHPMQPAVRAGHGGRP